MRASLSDIKVQPIRKTKNSNLLKMVLILWPKGFPSGAAVKNLLANAGDPRDVGLIPGFNLWIGKISWGRKWSGNPLHCLENSMDRGTWRATWRATHSIAWKIPWTEEPGGQQSVGVSKRQTWLSNWASKTLAYTDIFECHAQHRCQRVPSSELYK